MLVLTFQISLLALILFSFLMLIAVPVVFASPNGWNDNKNYLLLSAATWTALVLLVGTLNSFVV
uniref:Photosystem II reaction center protein Z n=1 Tax=Discoplastis spathirhyncha TaxID=215771 RepID=A0A3G3LLC9_9EUGL|nr:photosystem II protein Z [Discoplastis spathirhyncha]AYQ93516.1 photosystem II protein Z [Discoplastis spathirhyncha]